MRSRPRSSARAALVAVVALVTVATACVVVACGGNSAADTSDLTVNQRLGLEAAQQAGCSSCHGAHFDGGVGPTWHGLAGSTVTLKDGSKVTADNAYLTEAIADPSAQLVAGYDVAMPTNSLSAEDIARIVDYIEALG